MASSAKAPSLKEIEASEYVVIVGDRIAFASKSLVETIEYRIKNGGMLATILRDVRD